MHSKLRRSSSKKKNMIEFDPCEDIYEPLDFKNDWSKELKKNYEIHMRNICFNFDSHEPEVDYRRKRCKAKKIRKNFYLLLAMLTKGYRVLFSCIQKEKDYRCYGFYS